MTDLMRHWIRVMSDEPMGPLTGDRPPDDVFTGALTGRMFQAIMQDAGAALQDSIDESDGDAIAFERLLYLGMRDAVMHAARRISIEMAGCTIDPNHDPDDESELD